MLLSVLIHSTPSSIAFHKIRILGNMELEHSRISLLYARLKRRWRGPKPSISVNAVSTPAPLRPLPSSRCQHLNYSAIFEKSSHPMLQYPHYRCLSDFCNAEPKENKCENVFRPHGYTQIQPNVKRNKCLRDR